MNDEMLRKIEHDKYVTYFKMYYNEVFKNIKPSYDKLNGETTTISAYGREVNIAVPARFDILGEEVYLMIYCRSKEKDHYYNTSIGKEIFFNYEGNAYRILLDGGEYIPSKYVSNCTAYVYNKKMVDNPNDIDKDTCIFEKEYEIELDDNTNIITEVIRKIKEKEIEDKPLTTDNDIYRKIVKLIRMAKTEEEAIELLEENLNLLLITDSAKAIIDHNLLEGPSIPPYVQERIDQEWEEFGQIDIKKAPKDIGYEFFKGEDGTIKQKKKGTKPNNSNNKD